MSTFKSALFAALAVLGLACVGLQLACKPMTPAAQAEYDRLDVQAQALADELPAAYAEYKALRAEYDGIVLQVKAGVPLPAAVADRLQVVTPLLTKAQLRVESLYAKVNGLIAQQAKVKAEGGTWYNRVPWGTIGGVLCGIAGTYFPVVRPLQGAAQAMIRGVSAYYAAPETDPREPKDFIREASVANGSELTLHGMVQAIDPSPKIG